MYVRRQKDDGSASVHLLTSKSNAAPVKVLTFGDLRRASGIAALEKIWQIRWKKKRRFTFKRTRPVCPTGSNYYQDHGQLSSQTELRKFKGWRKLINVMFEEILILLNWFCVGFCQPTSADMICGGMDLPDCWKFLKNGLNPWKPTWRKIGKAKESGFIQEFD